MEKEAKETIDNYDLPLDDYNFPRLPSIGKAGFETGSVPYGKGIRYYFNINDENGEAIFLSEFYGASSGRDKGLKSVFRNLKEGNDFELKEKKHGEEKRYYFLLRAGNSQEIGRSPEVETIEERENQCKRLKKLVKSWKDLPEPTPNPYVMDLVQCKSPIPQKPEINLIIECRSKKNGPNLCNGGAEAELKLKEGDVNLKDEITYTFIVKNTGTVTLAQVELGIIQFLAAGPLSAPQLVKPKGGPDKKEGHTFMLGPDKKAVYTAVYKEVQQTDIDAGRIKIWARVTARPAAIEA